jgi:hypothetical protein
MLALAGNPIVRAAAAAFVMTCGLQNSVAGAQDQPPYVGQTATTARPDYYVDFRAIDGFAYGHTHIAYGRLNARGGAMDVRYAGFEPEGAGLGLAVGQFVGVAGSIKTSKESVNFAIIDSYRRKLTASQYRSLIAAVERTKRQPQVWNVVFHNCNDFVSEMARTVGLRTPSNLVHPYMYVAALRSLNEP